MFLSGFFRKEQVLIGVYNFSRNVLTLFFILALSRITLAYCVKLAISLLNVAIKRVEHINKEGLFLGPVVILRRITVFIGYFINI